MSSYTIAEWARILRDYKFWTSIILLIIINIICVWEWLIPINGITSVVRAIDYVIVGHTPYRSLIAPIITIVYVMSYHNEINSTYKYLIIARIGKNNYLKLKTIMCTLSAYSSMFISMLIFSLIVYFKAGAITINGDEYLKNYACGELLTSYNPIIYILAIIAIYSMNAPVYAVFSLMMTNYTCDKYLIALSPYLYIFLREAIFDFLHIQPLCKSIFTATNIYKNPFVALSIMMLSTSSYIALFGYIYIIRTRRNIA